MISAGVAGVEAAGCFLCLHLNCAWEETDYKRMNRMAVKDFRSCILIETPFFTDQSLAYLFEFPDEILQETF